MRVPFRTVILSAPLVVLSLSAVGAAGQTLVTPADRTSLGVTVYANFAQVRDTRRVDFSGGADLIWAGVPRTLDPGTVLLWAGGEPVAFASQAFDAGEGRMGLLAGRVGGPVTLVSPTGERQAGTLESPIGPVFRVGDRLILEWKGHYEIPNVPPDLSLDPVFRWRLAGAPAGARELTASYLADGISWGADYVAVLAADDARLALSGRVTIRNPTDFAFPDAAVQLVAGNVRRERGAGPEPLMMQRMAADGVAEMAMGGPDIGREGLGDYHLYTIDEPVTLGRGETTQLELFRAPRVPVRREYVLHGQEYWHQSQHPEIQPPQPLEIWLRFTNQRAAGLGEPLPAGVIHVYRTDRRGTLQFIGDGSIPHTPADEEVAITIGQAFDLVAVREQTAYRQLDERTHESSYRIEVRNRGGEARTASIYEPFSGDWTVISESRPHERVNASMAKWTLPVPAGGTAELTFTVRVRY